MSKPKPLVNFTVRVDPDHLAQAKLSVNVAALVRTAIELAAKGELTLSAHKIIPTKPGPEKT
jgi:post-segregation antitoxin (ccd killing protein)